MGKIMKSDLANKLRSMASIETSALYSQRKVLNEAADMIDVLDLNVEDGKSEKFLVYGNSGSEEYSSKDIIRLTDDNSANRLAIKLYEKGIINADDLIDALGMKGYEIHVYRS